MHFPVQRDEIASVFDPVVSKIVSLISEQIHGVFSKMAKRPKVSLFPNLCL
jgi:hypothetical protein